MLDTKKSCATASGHRQVKRILCVCIALLGFLGVAPGASSQSVGPPVDSLAIASTARRDLTFEQARWDMATVVAKMADVSPFDALAMFDASRYFGDAEAVMESDPGYAGSWYEYGAKLEVSLVIGVTSESDPTIRAVADSKSKHIRFVDRKYSARELSHVASDLMSANRRAWSQVYVDVIRNEVVILAADPKSAGEVLRGFSVSVPTRIEFFGGSVSPASGVSGGVGMWWDTFGHNCTSGFSLLNTSGQTAVLTAGHCTSPTGPTSGPPSMPGDPDWVGLSGAESRVWGGSQDREIHIVPAPHYAIGRFATLHSGWVVPQGKKNPSLNEYVCKTGQTTSTTCFNVNNVNYSVTYTGTAWGTIAMNNLFTGTQGDSFRSCDFGDSGGPIWNGNVQAVGLVEGSIRAADGSTRCIGAKILAQIPTGWVIGT